jgi:amino acid transporter
VASFSNRPRNVGSAQAAAILYGDWGTSKAYVIGLAFALAGHSSFWLLFGVSILMLLVGCNYMTICKFSPSGGGVYASAKKHSEVLALIGAFFLISDYLITASLSALSCFSYLGFGHPAYWAMGSILAVGAINYFGPKHTGNLALIISVITFTVVLSLAFFSLPYIGQAINGIQAPTGGFLANWDKFVGIIVALSGVEAIANATGVMRLDVGSSEDNPKVGNTAKWAILWVMIEVCFFTAFFGLMMQALPGLEVLNGEVNAPGHSDVRDYMLRYMGEYFVSEQINPFWGVIFGGVVGGVFAILLLSAVNTAIIALVALLFAMSRDGELPERFQKMTVFGVPIYPLLLASIVPVIVLFFVSDIAHLVDLYAVGFVGAITTNLGVNAMDKTLPLSRNERFWLYVGFFVMAAIEITLLFTKPDARRFVLSILTGGLILRAFVAERRQKKWAARQVKMKHASLYADDSRVVLHYGAILCAVRNVGKTLNFALQESQRYEQPLYILYVREQKYLTEEDLTKNWVDDRLACTIFDYAKESSHEMTIKFLYVVSDSAADTIASMAKKLRVSRVILGRPRTARLLQLLRGNIVREVAELLPEDIDLLVIS